MAQTQLLELLLPIVQDGVDQVVEQLLLIPFMITLQFRR